MRASGFGSNARTSSRAPISSASKSWTSAVSTPATWNSRSRGCGTPSASVVGISTMIGSPMPRPSSCAKDLPTITRSEPAVRSARLPSRWSRRCRATSPSCVGSMPRRRTGIMSGLRMARASISMNGDAPVTPAPRARAAPVPASRVPRLRTHGHENTGVRRERQQPLAQLAFQAVHDRKDDDERGDAQAHAQQRHPGDEGDEELVGTGAHVTQPDEQGQGIQHRAGLWAKNLTDITKVLLDIVGSRRQRLTLPYRGVYFPPRTSGGESHACSHDEDVVGRPGPCPGCALLRRNPDH